jgi:hypothetical protein
LFDQPLATGRPQQTVSGHRAIFDVRCQGWLNPNRSASLLTTPWSRILQVSANIRAPSISRWSPTRIGYRTVPISSASTLLRASKGAARTSKPSRLSRSIAQRVDWLRHSITAQRT